MAQILCISYLPWGEEPFRTQSLLSHIPEVEILFFQPAPAHKFNVKQTGQQVLPGITVYRLPAGFYQPQGRSYAQRRALDVIQQCMDTHGFEEPLLWACTPVAVHLLEALTWRGVVYDCDKIWNEFPVNWESNLAYRSDLILTASPGLEERLSLCNDNIACIPSGVDFPLFSMVARTRLPAPADFRPITLLGPVFGYLGDIDARLDMEPVLFAAAARPDWQFVCLGRVHPRNPFLNQLEAARNIHLLGSRPRAILPDYLYRFDVCFDLIHTDDPEDDVLPPRVYAYLLSGKPMVLMHLPYAPPILPDVVRNAETPEEFVIQCEKALRENNHWARGRRKRLGGMAAWVNRYNETCNLLELNGMI